MYPGETAVLEFEVRSVSAGSLMDIASADIDVIDGNDVTRVPYSSDSLQHNGTGLYSYSFTIPDDVIEGEWRVNLSVSSTLGTTKKQVYFPVRQA